MPFELVLYTASRTALPDEVIVAKIETVLTDGLGPFDRIWLFGDQVQFVASNS